MSLYINPITGDIKTQGQWRAAHPNVSLPRVWRAATLAGLGLQPVLEAPAPVVTPVQTAVRDGVTTDANGNVVQAWKVVDKFESYFDDEDVPHTKEKQEAAYMAELAAKELEGKVAAIEAEFAEQVKQITAGYSEDEIKTWDKQVAEAEAYTANAAAPTPLLDALTGATGDSKADLVGRVMFKANAYATAVGAVLGAKQKAVTDLSNQGGV